MKGEVYDYNNMYYLNTINDLLFKKEEMIMAAALELFIQVFFLIIFIGPFVLLFGYEIYDFVKMMKEEKMNNEEKMIKEFKRTYFDQTTLR